MRIVRRVLFNIFAWSMVLPWVSSEETPFIYFRF